MSTGINFLGLGGGGEPQKTYLLNIHQTPLYYPDNSVKQIVHHYVSDPTKLFEQRFEYLNGKVVKEELKDDIGDNWVRIEYTYNVDGSMNLPTYTSIESPDDWTITL